MQELRKHTPQELDEVRRTYQGEPLETGGTSIAGKVAPSIRWLFDQGFIKPTMTVLDYGAGKYARNADFFREQGMVVYAYDPFNGVGSDGYSMGAVAKELPDRKFDVVFTAYVLNVVPDHTEDDILAETQKLGEREFHATRNTDIFDSVKKALARKAGVVWDFFKQEFEGSDDPDDQEIMSFCFFGVQTSRGFQRIPDLEAKGYELLRRTGGFKIYGG